MFPENRLSTILVADDYIYPYTLTPPNKRVAYSHGGININDPSQGIRVQLWTAYVEDGIIMLNAPSLAQPVIALSGDNISELTLAFDQNMNYTLAYVQNSVAKLYWFDTFLSAYTITEFPSAISPRITLDDKRPLQTSLSDLVLGYVKNDNLYFRLQRDRFLNEYLLKENVQARLDQMGMNVKNRLQFKLKPFRT
jgi:hypothetical protein